MKSEEKLREYNKYRSKRGGFTMYYECIVQDTFNKLEVGKIYYIEDNWLYNDAKTIKLFYITTWQLKNTFRLKEVSE